MEKKMENEMETGIIWGYNIPNNGERNAQNTENEMEVGNIYWMKGALSWECSSPGLACVGVYMDIDSRYL